MPQARSAPRPARSGADRQHYVEQQTGAANGGAHTIPSSSVPPATATKVA